MEQLRKTSLGMAADPNLKCHWCDQVLRGATVDEQYEDYKVHVATRLDDAKNGLVNHNPIAPQWIEAHLMIEAGRESQKAS